MKIPSELAKYNLVAPSKPVVRRLVMSSEGSDGCGKSDFFYRTFPKPQLSIQLDLNDEGAREKQIGEDVLIKEIHLPPMPSRSRNEEDRAADAKYAIEIRDLYYLAVTKHYFRSVMIDEGWALYELARRAHLLDLSFGGSSQPSYAPVNAYMKKFFSLAKSHRVNFYLPHRQTDERRPKVSANGKTTSEATGKKVYDGWKGVRYESMCHLLLERDEHWSADKCNDCGKKKAICKCDKFVAPYSPDQFKAIVKKCSANPAINGLELTGDEITLSNLGQMIWPTSSDEDWQ